MSSVMHIEGADSPWPEAGTTRLPPRLLLQSRPPRPKNRAERPKSVAIAQWRRTVQVNVVEPDAVPEEAVTVTVEGGAGFDHLSVAAMLIPTNDGFFALNGAAGPRGDQTVTLFSPAYDAGSERNDELCASIPGPFFAECGGPGGGGKPGGGEGFVHVHAGIHGTGNLNAAQRDWRNPVAEIAIRRVP